MSSDSKVEEKPNLKGDRLNILLLLSMYTLQCLPRNLGNAVQLILQNRHVTYVEQSVFSLVTTTYSLKILWAPVVDCTFSKKMGRRKSWVIPTQYLISALLLFQSMRVEDWTGSEDGTKRPNIPLLTVTFFLVHWFSSLQDIAVDAWALTMLQKRNVGQQGTCNSAGYALGQMFGYVIFTLLTSKDFCNYFRSVPQNYGFVNFSEFMLFWAIVFIIMNTLIMIFKRDNSLDCIDDDSECRLGIIESYKRLWRISTVGPVRKLCFILLTCLIFFGPITGVASLKLMDEGVPRDKFVLVSLPTVPALLTLPFILSRYLTKKRALGAFLACFTLRMAFTVMYATFIYFTSYFKSDDDSFPVGYYVLLFSLYNIDSIADYGLWLTAAAFGSHISDVRFGAMYATLLSTMVQIGNKWANTIFIWLKDKLTFTSCSEVNNMKVCTLIVDGFFVEIIICILSSFVWLYWARKQVRQLNKMDVSAFRVPDNPVIVAKNKLLYTSGTPVTQTLGHVASLED